MVLQCCVKGCETVGKNNFHSFPTKKLTSEKWILAAKALHLIDRLNANKLSNSFYKICRKHFRESDLTTNGKGKIVVKQNSAPSLFLPNEVDVPPVSTKPVKEQQFQHSMASNNSASQFGKDLGSDVDVEGLPSEEQTAGKISKGSGRKLTQRSKVTNGSHPKMLSYYKRRVKELQQQVKSNKLSDSAVLNYLKSLFNDQLMEFFSMQLKNCRRSKHGRRYSAKQKSLCLVMYKQGPKSYRFNESWCCLPTARTLGRYSAQLIFKSGVDSKMLAAVKNIVTQWPQENRYCSIGWDEVSLNAHLDYCQSLDKIEGFVEMCKPKEPIFATHSLTFMVRGIAVHFKQCIGYFYTNGLKAIELVELIKLMIEKALATGLIPILSLCDTYNTNANAVNELAYPNANQTKQTGNLLQYTVKGRKITHTFDPSHIIKVLRNNFQVKNLAHFVAERWRPDFNDYDGSLQIAAWGDIDHFYRTDLRSIRRMVPKLTEEHLKPNKLKMKVSVAAQVFSNTCGLAMQQCVEHGTLPKHFTSTAHLILFMNDLFDSINGSDKHPTNSLKSAMTRNSMHSEFWDYALVMLENMFYVDKDTGARNNRSSVLTKIESTIRGYQEVAKMCFAAGIPKINIRDTTQDGLENFFGCVKSCNQSNTTTASQYRTGYATMVINNITGTNSLKSNCQPDDSTAILSNIYEFISVCQEQPHEPVNLSYPEGCDNLFDESEPEDFDSVIMFDTEVRNDFSCSNVIDVQSEAGDTLNHNDQFLETNVDISQLTVISNEANRICQKLFKTTSCNECKENFGLMDQSTTLLSVEKLLAILNKTIAGICTQDSIKKKLLSSVQEVNVHVVGCYEHVDVIERKLKNVAVEYFLLSFCNDINQILSGKTVTLPDKPNPIQKLAFAHRIKKKKIGKYSDKFN